MHDLAFDLASDLVSDLGSEHPLGIQIAWKTMLGQSLIQSGLKLLAHGFDEPVLHRFIFVRSDASQHRLPGLPP